MTLVLLLFRFDMFLDVVSGVDLPDVSPYGHYQQVPLPRDVLLPWELRYREVNSKVGIVPKTQGRR